MFTQISKHLNSLFPACDTLCLLQQLHGQIVLNGLHRSVFFGSKLADAYIESDSLLKARKVFDQIPVKNSYSWNTIISGYWKSQNLTEVLRLCRLMRRENHEPDSFNLVFAIRACTGLCFREEGESFHSSAIRWGLDADIHVAPALIRMYIGLGCLEGARKIFDVASVENPEVWGVMMKGYLKASKETEVFGLIALMKELEIELDSFSTIGLIRACTSVCAGNEGSAVHGFCVKKNFLNSNVYLQTSLVDTYIKCGLVGCAYKLFEEIPCKDVVSWSTMVAGLAQNGRAWEALQVFRRMLQEFVMPNEVTLASVLPACSALGVLLQGKSIHGYGIRNNLEFDVVSCTALLDMYAKCGSIECACRVFDRMPTRNLCSWSAVIGGFGMYGLWSEALGLFNRMRVQCIVPNYVTFSSVLSACSHSGKVQEGWHCFGSMVNDYGITPRDDHYSCMVDLLGRVGLIDEAESFVRRMPTEPSAIVWGALLYACLTHKRAELAEQVANKLLDVDQNQPGAIVSLLNIYVAAGMWEMVKKMISMTSEMELQKAVGFSRIEVDKKIYMFNAKNGMNYHHNSRIRDLWCVLSEEMRALGYSLDVLFVLPDVDDAY